MSATCDSDQKCDLLVHFHPSALRHFERAHMIAEDLDLSHSFLKEVQSTKQERCKQWVLNELGTFSKDLASWDCSVKYDSGSGRLDSCSVYSGVLDSCRSCPAGLPVNASKIAQNLESWTSVRSPPVCFAQMCARPSPTIASDMNGIDVPRLGASSGHEPGDHAVQENG